MVSSSVLICNKKLLIIIKTDFHKLTTFFLILAQILTSNIGNFY